MNVFLVLGLASIFLSLGIFIGLKFGKEKELVAQPIRNSIPPPTTIEEALKPIEVIIQAETSTYLMGIYNYYQDVKVVDLDLDKWATEISYNVLKLLSEEVKSQLYVFYDQDQVDNIIIELVYKEVLSTALAINNS